MRNDSGLRIAHRAIRGREYFFTTEAQRVIGRKNSVPLCLCVPFSPQRHRDTEGYGKKKLCVSASLCTLFTTKAQRVIGRKKNLCRCVSVYPFHHRDTETQKVMGRKKLCAPASLCTLFTTKTQRIIGRKKSVPLCLCVPFSPQRHRGLWEEKTLRLCVQL